MVLENILIAPHGEEILNPKDDKSMKLNQAMMSVSSKIHSDEYVIVTPHNIRIDDNMAVILTQYAEGKVGMIRRKYKCDRNLAYMIYKRSKSESLPVVGVNFGALEGELSRITLDWGSLIPLYFLKKKKIVIITPARGVDRGTLREFGRVIGETVKSYNKRITVIISADHSHTHDPKGPYGYSDYAKVYDSLIIDTIKGNKFENLMSIDQKIIDEAKPDSYWQLLILLGILDLEKEFKTTYFEYQVPSYFGMAVALLEKS